MTFTPSKETPRELADPFQIRRPSRYTVVGWPNVGTPNVPSVSGGACVSSVKPCPSLTQFARISPYGVGTLPCAHFKSPGCGMIAYWANPARNGEIPNTCVVKLIVGPAPHPWASEENCPKEGVPSGKMCSHHVEPGS